MSRSPTATLLANGPYARNDAPYRLLEVRGPDAGDFLQRLCTQDVLTSTEGSVVPAAFLDAKGKVKATCLVFRLAGSFWLETHAEQAGGLLELLERFHFTEKLTIASRDLGRCGEQIGWPRNSAEPDRCAEWLGDGQRLLRIVFTRRGVRFERSHGGEPASVEVHDDASERPIEPKPLPRDLAECLRMAAGLVRIGVDTEASTLALEADLDDHCSTTKGCYTGQEIVARIHTYGHVNRKLCLLRLPDGPEITAPVPLCEREDRIAVGRVMHAVPWPGQAVRLGLGYLPADFQALGTRLVLAEGAAGDVTVVGFDDAS